MIASDGRPAGIVVQIDDHRTDALPYVLNDIADRWRIARADIETVLAEWDEPRLREHLSGFTSEELKPPALRR